MLHVLGLGGDGLTGWSVVKFAQQSMGGGLAGDQYAASVFGNQATPTGVLEHPMRFGQGSQGSPAARVGGVTQGF